MTVWSLLMLYGIVVVFLLIALSDYLLNIVICIE